MFSYLGIAGGIEGTPVYGSLSVHVRAGLGSPFPRSLRAGDALEVGAAAEPIGHWPSGREIIADGPVRIILGPQDDYFTVETIEQFLATEWRISPTSDRMGYTLDGPRLAHAKGYNIVSRRHCQWRHPDTGQRAAPGSSRRPRHHRRLSQDRMHRDRRSRPLSQTPVGGTVRFEAISVEAAQALARGFADAIARLAQGLHTDWSQLSSEALLAVNLAGEAVDALDEPARRRTT